MGFLFSKRKKIGKGTTLNFSTRGLSVSKKAGPFSLSTRGNASVRIGRGFGFRKKLW